MPSDYALSLSYPHLTKLLVISTFMQDDIFDWHDAKAASNWRDHGVAFSYAVKVFRDPFAVEWIDGRENYGE